MLTQDEAPPRRDRVLVAPRVNGGGPDLGVEHFRKGSREGACSAQRVNDLGSSDHASLFTLTGNVSTAKFADNVIALPRRMPHQPGMITTREILEALEDRGVSKTAIAQALGVANARVTELYKGDRKLSHDEAVTLAEMFDLVEDRGGPPLTLPLAKLLVLLAAHRVGAEVDPEEPVVEELAQEFVALASAQDVPGVREAMENIPAMFAAMRLRQQLDQKRSA